MSARIAVPTRLKRAVAAATRPAIAALFTLATLISVAAPATPAGAADAPNVGFLTLSDGSVAVSTTSSSTAAIQRLYHGVLGREADAAGLLHWQTANMALEDIARDFVRSEEFISRFGSSNEAIIANLYRNVLQRDPDAAGLTYWANEITRNPVERIVVGFTESAEFVAIHPGSSTTTSEIRWNDQLTPAEAREMASRFFTGLRLEQALVIMECESQRHTTQVATNNHGSFSSYDIGLMQINNYYNGPEIKAAFAAAPADIAAIINAMGGGDEALLHPLVNLYMARWIVDHSDWRITGSSSFRNQRWGGWTCAAQLNPAEYWY
ncbi:MAG: DUF4214 domain-containing protein [Acidimicrobiales bacterium]